jgi:hypothetical protein
MTTITKIEEKTYQGKVTGHAITLSDGTTGYLDDKNSTTGLRMGDSVTFTSVDKTNKKGGPYKLLTLTLQGQEAVAPPALITPPIPRPQIHVGTGKSPQELKAEASTRIAEIAFKAVFDDKISSAEAAENHKFYTRLVWSDIDEVFGSK